MKDSSQERRIGRTSGNGRCKQLGAQVRNYRIHGSRALKSLKSTMARGQNTGLVRHLRSGVGGESTRIAVTTEGYWMHPEAPAVTIIRLGGLRYVR